MKTKIFITAVLALAFLAGGCAGHRSAELNLNKEKGIISHKDTNFSLLTPSIGPVDMALAYSIKKEADTKELMISSMMRGDTAGLSGRYLMVLQNNDLRHQIFMWHPEIPNQKITAKPNGGFDYFTLRDIPEEFIIYDMAGSILTKIQPRYISYFNEKISHKKQFGAFLVDLIITVNKVNDSKIN